MAKIALLIGVSEYELGLNSLPGAVMDVDAMQQVLQHPDVGEFAPSDITVLKNPQRQTMEEAIETLFFNRQKDDLVLLYFSGHGIKDDSGRLFLATRQTRKNTKGELVRTTAVAASLIHDVMENSRSRRQVIILDCCFSGAFAEGMRAKDDGSLDIKNQLAETQKPQSVEGRAVLTSSTATQYSFEQQGSDLSVYTRYLVEGIEKGAADIDNDGVISVDELHEYARKKVQEAAPAMKPGIFAVREGYKIQLAKAPIGDPRLEYRKEVEKCIRDGQVSRVGRRILNRRQSELGLSADVAREIENEVLEPYRQRQENLQEYAEALTEALEDEGTLSHHTREDLKRLQQLLQLRDEDIAPIEARLTPPPTPPRKQGGEPDEATDLQVNVAKNTTPAAPPPPTTDEDDLSSEKGVKYAKLRDLLAAQKWKEADYETYLVMLQAVGRKENDWIKREELLTFPCTDLRTIDQLWVKYSNGRFGFSVQKEIYLSVGGKPDGKYYQEAWEKFGDRVGWRVQGNWISDHDNVSFHASAPEKGYLPFTSLGGGFWFGGKDGCWFLFSRIETCQSHSIEDDLSSEKGVDYTKLRDLLAAQNWKEADYETYLVMLQAVGRKENDWIRDEELLNFPCADLRTIDQLWVKYSNGRFGFRVQKKIYMSVGGKPDGNYDEEAWEKFGDRVGWRVKENWISDDEVIFDTTAPEGHLPLQGACVWDTNYLYLPEILIKFFSLPLRLVMCNI
ncbi:caspase, EACC1-associated type [Scytonema sp. PCC 10023]|uniref:caspase, EACC1-associated type n=1 Tax=Scytonema sp. PCC 10023 TaxID=1680591 RepID=UPI0039C62D31